MSKHFKSASELSEFLSHEREQALKSLCEDLSCSRESLVFIFEGEEIKAKDLEIPCRRDALIHA